MSQVSKSYGVKQLLDQVDFAIRTGDRIGLIGPNGTGKSSFLKVIAGLDTYDHGEIKKPNQYEIAYLAQNPQLNPDQTILETVYDSKAANIQLLLAYEQTRLKLAAAPNHQGLQKQLLDLTDQMTLKDAWDVEVAAKSVLSQLKLENLNQKVGQCSGGQQKRIGIAQVLIAEPDLLILDEPTNHLDVASIQWLENYLANYQGALLLVTHDRYFLERVVNKIVELRHGRLTFYDGNYKDYLSQRAENLEVQARQAHKQDQLYLQELAWMRQGAQARSTKQQARIDRFNELKDQIAQRDQDGDGINCDFNQQRIGNQILDLEKVSIEIADKQVIKDYTKVFVKGDRLGIIGPNGVGKSTFLNVLAGYHSISAGSYQVGQTVRLAYYRQLDQDLPADMRVLTYLTQVADQFKRPDGSKVSASQLLERFNFAKETHGSLIQSLSGGEKRRLYLLTLLVQEPNVLLLDEPTNDLDIDTLTTLEDYLASFEGVVIVVSHDRYFLDKTCDQLLDLQGQGDFAEFIGSYSEYLDKKATTQVEPKVAEVAKEVETNSKPAVKESKQRMTYQEKKEWADIEDRIAKLEEKIDHAQKEMEANPNDAGKVMDLHQAIQEDEETLLELYERYEYLSGLSLN